MMINMNSQISSKRLSSTKLLKINILDENDNGPQFDQLSYKVKIFENSLENTELIQLNAIDKDEESHIIYRFAQSTDQFIQNYSDIDLNLILKHFKIDNKLGSIKTTNIPLDRESKDSFLIPIIAYDDEYPSRTSNAWIHVEIGDINDNTPHLIGNTTFWIDEEGTITEHGTINSPTSSLRQYHGNYQIFIGRLLGEDDDIGENGQIIFKLGFTNQNNLNNISKWFLHSDGMLFVQSTTVHNNGDHINNYLDRETIPVYKIPIIISDLGKNPTRSSTGTVTISLRDINDNSPKFLKPSYHDLNFTLKDNSQSSLSIPKIMSPNIPSERINILRLDNSNPGTLIYTVHAIDSDDGNNGKVIYKLQVYEGYWQLTHNSHQSISKNDTNRSTNDYFIIDQNSGEIRINKPITLDNLQKIPKCLVVFAEDCGIPSRRNYAFLYIDAMTEEEEEEEEQKKQKLIDNNNQRLLNPVSVNNTKNRLNFIDRSINLTDFKRDNKQQLVGLNSNNNNNNPQLKLLKMDNTQMYPHSNSRMKYSQSVNTKFPSSLQSNSLNEDNDDDDDDMEKLISNYRIMMNTGESDTVNTNQYNSTDLITGLGIGLVIIILVCLLLLLTYAIHGTQNIRLTRNTCKNRRTKVNDNIVVKEYKNDEINETMSMEKNCENDHNGRKFEGPNKRWRQFCNAMRFVISPNRPMNNNKMSKRIETMISSKVYTLNHNKNISFTPQGVNMYIPPSGIEDSFHSDFSSTDPLKKKVYDKKSIYPSQSVYHKVIYPQLNQFIPVVSSVDMMSLSRQDTNETDYAHNTVIPTIGIVDNEKRLLTNLTHEAAVTNQHAGSNCDRLPRNYTVCDSGIISVSDYMTLSLHDTYNQYTKKINPTDCHFLMNRIKILMNPTLKYQLSHLLTLIIAKILMYH
ncbi:unnamed protein product [Heterobilharzia americana]|nr:unnamed protein product [Heterobilharzia americana]